MAHEKQLAMLAKDGWITVADAATMALVNQAVIYHLVQQDKIEHSRVGERIVVKEDSLWEHFGPLVKAAYEERAKKKKRTKK